MSTGWIAAELGAIEAAGRTRTPLHLSSAPGPTVEVHGRTLVHACSNNYLGLAGDERVVAAATKALERFGAGSGGSRLVTGGCELHAELEAELAALKRAEAALVFASGYAANIGTIPALVGRGDAIYSDALNHASIIDGCRLSGASVHVFRHASATHLEELLASTEARRKLVVTDTVFSMDGDRAPLRAISESCIRHGAMLMTDEAHATGVLGPDGAGAAEEAGVRADVVMGTLSKALGSAGGFVAGSRDLIELLRHRARSFVFDTAPPASVVAAALEALRIGREESWRRERVRALAARVAAGVRARGYDVPEPGAGIVPVVLGSEHDAVSAACRLYDRGVLAQAIRPPTVPDGTSRIRLTAMATHADEHIDRVIAAFER